jgi:tripartite-type tricarboxylate transporter receptor subunit TctC
MIVPFAAGGGYDLVGGILAEGMRVSLGQPIIIENVIGANGSIGVGRAARAMPDGYTIDLGQLNSHVLNGALLSLQYDLLNDFEPISPIVRTPVILYARKTMPANNFKELIAWLKANPEKASMGIPTASNQVLSASFQKKTGTHFQFVPYRGGAPAIQDLLAGQIDLFFDAPLQLSLVRAGKLKAYAVTTHSRLAAAPDLPTFAEVGLPALFYSPWYGLFAPKGTPKEIIAKLNAAVVEALDDQTVRSRMVDLGYELFAREQRTPEALGALQKADATKWWPIIKEFGIKAE